MAFDPRTKEERKLFPFWTLIVIAGCVALWVFGAKIYQESMAAYQSYAAITQNAAQNTYYPGVFVDGIDLGGMTREEAGSSSGATAIIFGLCLLFVYLLLSAQYESYVLPWAVILSIPFGLMGAFVFARIEGLANSVYLQIALIMLIGLLAKNAILIVEFALERRRTGMSIVNSAIAGATARLRPILMTSMALIIGLLPMMFAHGVGANGNISVGTGTVGGLLAGTLALLFVVPVLFVPLQYAHEKLLPGHKK